MSEAGNPSNRAGEATATGPNNSRMRSTVALCVTMSAYWYLTGLIVVLAIWFGYSLVAPGPDARRTGRDPVDALRTFDGEWYALIATRGYSYDVASRSSVAFFPLYPLLAREVVWLLSVRIETALLIVSNVSLLGGLMALAIYVRGRFPGGPRDLPDYVVLAAVLFPTACFFRLPYSESTFLLLAVVAMLGISRRWPLFIVAAIVGLATAARPVGVALLCPLSLDIWRRHDSLVRRIAAMGAWLPVACWGLLGFMTYQHSHFGDSLAFVKAQRYWGVLPAPGLTRRLADCITLDPIAEVYQSDSAAFWRKRDPHGAAFLSLTFANPLFFLSGAALVVIGTLRRVNWLNRYEVSLSALLLLIPYVTRGPEMGMASIGRFVAVVFPIYIVIGRILGRLPPALAAAILAASGVMLACYSALFVGGYAVF